MSVILTIDDGPSGDSSRKLALLDERGIKAIWFCLGKHIESNTDVLVRAILNGHLIANHSYSHPHFGDITYEEAESEIIRTDKLIGQLYKSAGVSRPIKLFRFPYGEKGKSTKSQLQDLLRRQGFTPPSYATISYQDWMNPDDGIDWLWSYDIQEWGIDYAGPYHRTEEQVQNNLKNFLKNHQKNLDHIILVHDHERTGKYFGQLVETMLRGGIEFEDPLKLLKYV